MLRIHAVTSFDQPELAPYRTMRRQQEQRNQGIFVAEGEKVVRRLIESGLEIVSLLLPQKWLDEYQPLLAGHAGEIDAFVAEKAIIEELTGFSMYQGVLAVGKAPQAVSINECLATLARPLLFVAIEGITSAENVGGLVRNCAAFGCQGIIVGETSCSPYLRRAVRASMGTIFKMPVIESDNLLATLVELKRHGVACVAAHPHTDKKTVSDANFARDCCIVLGSEGEGIRPETLAACDEWVAIPMENGVDSLNVGTAGAVFLYEASRQRRLV